MLRKKKEIINLILSLWKNKKKNLYRIENEIFLFKIKQNFKFFIIIFYVLLKGKNIKKRKIFIVRQVN